MSGDPCPHCLYDHPTGRPCPVPPGANDPGPLPRLQPLQGHPPGAPDPPPVRRWRVTVNDAWSATFDAPDALAAWEMAGWAWAEAAANVRNLEVAPEEP